MARVNAKRQARARAHLRELSAARGITIRRVTTWKKAAARADLRVVWLPPMRTDMDYLSALHEFGHILDRRAAKLYNQGACEDTAAEIVMEAAAWAWALKHADRAVVGEMNDRLRGLIAHCWASYLCIQLFRPTTVRA